MRTRLGYDVHGASDAPVVLLGSSLGTDRTMWDEQLPVLAGRFRVVRYDHLGHGSSQVPDGPYTIEQLAGEVLVLLDDLGVQRAHVAGLSLGGMVAMQLAGTAPDRVDRLALMCTAAYLPPARGWLDRAATVRERGMEAVADAVAARWFTPAFAATTRAEALRAGLRSAPPEGYAACCEAIAATDLRPLLGSIRAPTLVIAGADDPATPPDLGQVVVDEVAGPARLEVVASAAHLGSVEQADVVGDLLLRHFYPVDDGVRHQQQGAARG